MYDRRLVTSRLKTGRGVTAQRLAEYVAHRRVRDNGVADVRLETRFERPRRGLGRRVPQIELHVRHEFDVAQYLGAANRVRERHMEWARRTKRAGIADDRRDAKLAVCLELPARRGAQHFVLDLGRRDQLARAA